MSLFSDLKPKPQLSRNVFDRSRSETFSTKIGMLTPCFVEHTVPKGKYKINVSDIVRVSEQQKPNFVGMSQNVEFAFVPYSQLWRGFNKMYYGRGEDTRQLSASPSPSGVVIPSQCPTFELKEVFHQIFTHLYFNDIYSRWVELIREAGHTPDASLLNWASSKGIRCKDGEFWYNKAFVDVHNRFCGFDQLRVLDLLGYGNFLPLFKYGFKELNVSNDNPTAVQIASALSVYETSIESIWTSLVSPKLYTCHVSTFALQAYVKFFNDIYKNREYETYTYNYLYNCDWYGSGTGDAYSTAYVLNMCKPYYRQYKKDLFTGLYPDSQFGNVSAVDSVSQDFKIFGSSSPENAKNIVIGTAGNLYATGSSIDTFNISPQPSISILALRQAEALQSFKESILRAGRREQDLQKSIFGVGSKYIENSYVDFLGSFSSSIQMNPVAATTAGTITNPVTEQSYQQQVGDLAAYSVGALEMGSKKDIEFEAYDFGIIIGFVYILPETKYEAFGIDMHNTKVYPSDFYNPKYQNLGLSPVYSYLNNLFQADDGNTVLGYLSRYYEYKTAISRVHGEFFGSNPAIPLEGFTDDFDSQELARQKVSSFGSFSDYVASRDVRETEVETLQMLYVNPKDTDRIFHVGDSYEQAFDHFKFEMSFRVKAVLPMSVVGLPSYHV